MSRRWLDEAWARSERMVGRRIGDEYVLVPLAGRGADLDSILNLNRVAAFVWEQLDGRRTGDAVVVRGRRAVRRGAGAGRAGHRRAPRHPARARGDRARLPGRAVGRVGGPERPSLARLLGCLAYQQTLLGDARRNRAFHRALAARVRPGHAVLDLGSGTGVWAVAAARLGARRVVAVEREAVLVPVIEALARENGVADRVEVVRADARRVSLPRAFDVVVSEMVGNEAFEEGLVPVFERARTLFLRRGGALVPEWVALAAAPVRAPVALGLSPRLLQSASVAALTAHVPRNLHPAELAPLAPGRELLRVDLREARAAGAAPPRPGPLPRGGRPVGGRDRGVGGDGACARREALDAGRDALAAHAPARRAPSRGPGPPRRRDRLEPRAAPLVRALRGRPRRAPRGRPRPAVRLGRGAPRDSPPPSLTAARAGD